MSREIHDHYFRQAKREGYRSRAAYKLIEIDERKRILDRGDRVLDCGAAPGSWLQVAARRVGPEGLVIGIDLQAIAPLPEANVRTFQAELNEIQAPDLLAALAEGGGGAVQFDVILSDMAANTTGDQNIDHHHSMRLCNAVLDRCVELLREGGNLVMKAFEGAAYRDLLERTTSMFEKVKGYKPKASRGISTEMYIVAEGFRGPSAADEGATRLPKPPPRPSGW